MAITSTVGPGSTFFIMNRVGIDTLLQSVDEEERARLRQMLSPKDLAYLDALEYAEERDSLHEQESGEIAEIPNIWDDDDDDI